MVEMNLTSLHWLILRLLRVWGSKRDISQSFVTLSDSQLLRELHPNLRQLDLTQHELFMLSFSLRNDVVALAGLFDALAVGLDLTGFVAERAREFLASHPLGERIWSELRADPDLPHWLLTLFPGSLPIVGLSAQGIHFTVRRCCECRAFDRYDLSFCGALISLGSGHWSEQLMCAEHRHWLPWLSHDSGVACEKSMVVGHAGRAPVQTQMFRYYGDKLNAEHTSPERLSELVGRFWERYAAFVRFSSSTRVRTFDTAISQALVLLEYGDIDDLQVGGRCELQRRYRRCARKYHPDAGGTDDSFARLVDAVSLLESLCRVGAGDGGTSWVGSQSAG